MRAGRRVALLAAGPVITANRAALVELDLQHLQARVTAGDMALAVIIGPLVVTLAVGLHADAAAVGRAEPLAHLRLGRGAALHARLEGFGIEVAADANRAAGDEQCDQNSNGHGAVKAHAASVNQGLMAMNSL